VFVVLKPVRVLTGQSSRVCHGIDLLSTRQVSMRQIPITVFVDNGTTQVPEPTTYRFYIMPD
jgi:hypothetical protein